MADFLSTNDGYSIEYSKRRNRIVIGLPQTLMTATSTVGPIINRKTDLSDHELACILGAVIWIFKETK